MPAISTERSTAARETTTGGQSGFPHQDLFASAMTCLTLQIHETHFLFLGERRCARRGQSIADLVDRSAKLRREIVALLGNV
jgi:hypothetical protein